MNIKPGIYEHYKGKQYQVVGEAVHSETSEAMVIYKALYKGDFPEGTLWVRPMGMFKENVEVNGKNVPRFRYLAQTIIAALLLLSTTIVFAQGRLTPGQIERVKVYKTLIVEVDKKTLAKTVAEIERTNDPEMVLQIQETIAKVYASVIADQGIKDQPTKEWLYNTVSMNMANLQFGGRVGGNPVNRMIAERLQKTLPKGITENPHYHVSVE